MNVLDLFSGIGGFSLGFERAGMRTAAFCEIDKYCRAVLRRHWPDVPIHEDVRKLDGAQFRGSVDLVCGGYPCQPFSLAGRRRGAEDERHLWPQMLRVIHEIRPRWVVAENVSGHVQLGFDEVAASLEAEGFAVWPFIVPACAVGAPHRRDRLWIVAHADRGRRWADLAGGDDAFGQDAGGPETDGLPRTLCDERAAEALADAARERRGKAGHDRQRSAQRASGRGDVRDAAGAGLQDGRRPSLGGRGAAQPQFERSGGVSGGTPPLAHADDLDAQGIEPWRYDASFRQEPGERPARLRDGAGIDEFWAVEPDVGRVAHGVSARVDRLRALGNAIVPQIAALIGLAIMRFERAGK